MNGGRPTNIDQGRRYVPAIKIPAWHTPDAGTAGCTGTTYLLNMRTTTTYLSGT